jgi:hypothetical protein
MTTLVSMPIIRARSVRPVSLNDESQPIADLEVHPIPDCFGNRHQ